MSVIRVSFSGLVNVMLTRFLKSKLVNYRRHVNATQKAIFNTKQNKAVQSLQLCHASSELILYQLKFGERPFSRTVRNHQTEINTECDDSVRKCSFQIFSHKKPVHAQFQRSDVVIIFCYDGFVIVESIVDGADEVAGTEAVVTSNDFLMKSMLRKPENCNNSSDRLTWTHLYLWQQRLAYCGSF